MKNKLIIILLILFVLSITSVSASDDNETQLAEISNDEEALSLSSDSQDIQSVPLNDDEVLSASSNSEEVISGANVELDNDADKENVNVGDYVTWIIKAQNFGPDSIAKNVKVVNKLPKGLKYIKHTTTKGTFNPKTGIWNIGDLKIGDGEVSLFITTLAKTIGEKINKAKLTTDTPNTSNKTYEEEEIDVFERQHEKHFNKEVEINSKHMTGNPIFLILLSLFGMIVPFKKHLF